MAKVARRFRSYLRSFFRPIRTLTGGDSWPRGL
jgi:hypothetical protein